MTKYVCIGVPYYLGEAVTDRQEVSVMAASGIADEIGAKWVNIEPNFATVHDPVVAVNRALAETIKAHSDALPLIFACDCTSALGAMKGLERLQPGILWYDAHGDFNTHKTTPSGFLGGMPLAMLCGRGDLNLMEGVELDPLPESKVIISDARDLDEEEGEMVRESEMTVIPRVEDLLETPLPDHPLYVHVDTDVIDPEEMPGMNYAAQGGPSVELTARTLERVGREANVAGVFFTLWDDTHDTQGRALDGTLKLIRAFVKGYENRRD